LKFHFPFLSKFEAVSNDSQFGLVELFFDFCGLEGNFGFNLHKRQKIKKTRSHICGGMWDARLEIFVLFWKPQNPGLCSLLESNMV
jgi:hypothetical protein